MKQRMLDGLKGFIRELVFGMEDGLVSNLGIVFAVWVATKNANVVLLSGLASMFAGALSMSAGSYLSSKSVSEVYDAEVKRAKDLVSKQPKKASREMMSILKEEKFNHEEIKTIMKHFLHHNKETFAINYIQKKLHVSPKTTTHPMHDAAVMFLAFAIGSMFPIFPFFFGDSITIMAISAILTILTLFAVGVGKTTVTRRDWFHSGMEIVLVGISAGVLGYLVGLVFGVIV